MSVKCLMRSLLSGTLALALMAAGFAQDISAEQKTKVLDGVSEVIARRAFVPGVDFTTWPKFIEEQREAIDKATTVPQFTTAVNQALRKFGFSHIVLQSPRQAERRTQTTAIGIGVSVQPNEQGLVVRAVNDGSPANKAGIVAGDVILTVDGQKAATVESITGEVGVKRKLEVLRASGEKALLEVELQRYSTTRKDTVTVTEGRKAVIKIHSFSAGYNRQEIEALIKEASEKSDYLVLDLRSNGGGAVVNMNHLLSMLLPDKTEFGVFVNRALSDLYKRENPDKAVSADSVARWAKSRLSTRARQDIKPYAGKIAVLTNRGSASASEIVALALRENVGAKIVGSKSMGAVLASTYARLEGGFQLQFPVSDYVSTKWVRIEGNPLVPDIEIAGPVADGVDPVIARAFEAIMPVAGTKPGN